MLRLLLTTTARTAVLATGALAQDAASSSMMDTSSSMMGTSSSMMDMSSSGMMDTSSSMMDMSSSSGMMDMSSSAMDTSSTMDSSMMSSQMTDASSMDSSMMSSATTGDATTLQPRTPVNILSGYTRVDTDRLTTKIVGQPVYDGAGADANNLGNITDLVLDQNGQVAAVVLGVGGFLGIGEKQVAVDYSALQFVVAAKRKRKVAQVRGEGDGED